VGDRVNQNDWLKKIGFRERLRRRDVDPPSGRYGACIFAEFERGKYPAALKAFSIIDKSGLTVFRLGGARVVQPILSLILTKDECQALFLASGTEGTRFFLVNLASRGCRSE